ncbi:MAG: bifunctional oligoribonuclease/PAP phosphatase NrnA [Ruminococcaceae bacterium]|nr:bifunctional oligoribonuclease/PAP phosphatase NrnA [Oscillospiraceae bacterium]
MSNAVGISEAAALLQAAKNILIITHKNPDGDTIGSAHAMWAAFTVLGKRAKIVNDGEFSRRYDFITAWYEKEKDEGFDAGFILAVDTAAESMMGESLIKYAPDADLCIDHHGTNSRYAKHLLCDSKSASCCEIVADVIEAMGVKLDTYMATCLYIGAATDTGCFKYSNTTAKTHMLAARAIELGVNITDINFRFFEEKSRNRLALEQMALAGLEITCGGRVAIMTVTLEMLERAGCAANDVEGITPIPRTIEGVEVGVTLREVTEGRIKVSLRTKTVDAAKICERFGGGGHQRAAGFECSGTQFDIKVAVIAEIEKVL